MPRSRMILEGTMLWCVLVLCSSRHSACGERVSCVRVHPHAGKEDVVPLIAGDGDPTEHAAALSPSPRPDNSSAMR